MLDKRVRARRLTLNEEVLIDRIGIVVTALTGPYDSEWFGFDSGRMTGYMAVLDATADDTMLSAVAAVMPYSLRDYMGQRMTAVWDKQNRIANR